jgi:hypothetical protein
MYLDENIQVFLDDFIVYEQKRDYIKQLQKCLLKHHRTGISQSPEKCAFSVNLGALKNFSRINHDKPATKVEDQLLKCNSVCCGNVLNINKLNHFDNNSTIITSAVVTVDTKAKTKPKCTLAVVIPNQGDDSK